MLRKHLVILIFIMVLGISVPFTFAGEVTSDDIIVAEPVKSKLVNDKSQFLIVNITNSKVGQDPVWFTLVKQEDKLPFAKQIESGLDVSVMLLSGKSAQVEGITPKRSYSINGDQYSTEYREEIKVINRFFELKTKYNDLEIYLARLSEGNNFTSFLNEAEAKAALSGEQYKKYLHWLEARKSRRLVVSELLEVQNKYLKMFETHLMSGKIDSMSFFKEIGFLENGQYRLRFLDSDNRLVKEIRFEVVDREANITPVLPLKITN